MVVSDFLILFLLCLFCPERLCRGRGSDRLTFALVLLAISCIENCLLISRILFLSVSIFDRDVTACFLNQLLLFDLVGLGGDMIAIVLQY